MNIMVAFLKRILVNKQLIWLPSSAINKLTNYFMINPTSDKADLARSIKVIYSYFYNNTQLLYMDHM